MSLFPTILICFTDVILHDNIISVNINLSQKRIQNIKMILFISCRNHVGRHLHSINTSYFLNLEISNSFYIQFLLSYDDTVITYDLEGLLMFDVVVIGAGPTGASAALFTAKAGKKTLVIDNDKSVTKRAWIENHYGVLEISGPDLIENGKKQASKFGAEMVQASVTNVSKTDNGFKVETDQSEYEAKHVIMATGMMADLAEKIGLTTKPGTEPRIKTILDVDTAGKTNIEGIWAAGTIAGVSMHTIITAGDGAKVAINVISEINGERYVDHDILKA